LKLQHRLWIRNGVPRPTWLRDVERERERSEEVMMIGTENSRDAGGEKDFVNLRPAPNKSVTIGLRWFGPMNEY